jgi:hypothetical protein
MHQLTGHGKCQDVVLLRSAAGWFVSPFSVVDEIFLSLSSVAAQHFRFSFVGVAREPLRLGALMAAG